MTVAKKVRGKRGRKALPGGERKDRLIQTRVADELDATLREEAKKRRLSVSQLIRNVLEDTFTLVDDVVNGTAKLAQQVRRDALRIRDSAQGLTRSSTEKEFQNIEVWQAVTLAGPTRCADCKAQLNLGESAMMGYSSDPSVRPVWVCMNCHTGM
jgi:hypothetical protein